MPGDRETAMAAGCNDYDTKPVDLPCMLAKQALKRPRFCGRTTALATPVLLYSRARALQLPNVT